MCDGWLHCFRDKDKYLPKTMNSLLLSESDFIDCQINKPDPTEKKYDFIYICHRDDNNDCSKMNGLLSIRTWDWPSSVSIYCAEN